MPNLEFRILSPREDMASIFINSLDKDQPLTDENKEINSNIEVVRFIQISRKYNDQDYRLTCEYVPCLEDFNRLRHAKIYRGNIDLFLLLFSYQQPDMFFVNVMQLYKEIKQFKPNIPILLLGLTDSNCEEKVTNEEVTNFQKKIKYIDFFKWDLRKKISSGLLLEMMILASIKKQAYIKPPMFFKSFTNRKETYDFIRLCTTMAQGHRQALSVCNIFPREILFNILLYAGNHLNNNETLLSLITHIFNSVCNSKIGKLKFDCHIKDNVPIDVYETSQKGKCTIS